MSCWTLIVFGVLLCGPWALKSNRSWSRLCFSRSVMDHSLSIMPQFISIQPEQTERLSPQKIMLRVGTVLAWTAALNFAHKCEWCCQCIPLYHSHYNFMVPWDHQQLYFSKEFHRDCHSTQCVVCLNVCDLWNVPLFYSHWQCSFTLRFLEHSQADTGQLSCLCVFFSMFNWEEL